MITEKKFCILSNELNKMRNFEVKKNKSKKDTKMERSSKKVQ